MPPSLQCFGTPAPGSQNTAKKEAHLQEQQTMTGTKKAFKPLKEAKVRHPVQ